MIREDLTHDAITSGKDRGPALAPTGDNAVRDAQRLVHERQRELVAASLLRCPTVADGR